MQLGIDPDELNTCVQCGLCLSSCPTFRVSGDETMSPRGRIALMREVQDNDAPITKDIREAFDTCVQCRGCEPACPSGVPYGRLIEQTKVTLASRPRAVTPFGTKLALMPLAHPRLLSLGTSALAVAQRLHMVPKRFGLPANLPFKNTPPTTSGNDVFLFTGCVMDVWQRDVHQAAQRVLEAAGFGVKPTSDSAPCCGALHTHGGQAATAKGRAQATIAALAGDQPIVVDSAGCGAAMKEYGHVVGTPEAVAFAARVFDMQEFIAEQLDRLPSVAPLELSVAIQDPCHLRHVQRVHEATRVALRPFVTELIELDDDGLCCGAGGAYSVLQPEMASDIRERKLASIGRAAPDVVASANPGCSMHLASQGAEMVHPIQLIDRALRGETMSANT